MSASPPERRKLFIDRNSGGRSFRACLAVAGLDVVLHDDEFPQTAADEDWMPAVGERQWIVITGDNATTSSPLFLQRLDASKTYVFVLLGLNGATPQGKADCILRTYETMLRLVRDKRAPAIWRIGKDGVAREFDFRRTLNRMRRNRKI